MAITIEFVGVCTHIRNDQVPHRVVLIDAREGRTVKQKAIPAHDSTIRIDGGAPQALSGVRLAIAGGSGGVTYAADWHTRMPKLVPQQPPFALSEGVRTLGNPELVDAWLDVTAGHFEVICHGKATGALLTIEAAAPRLITRPLGGPGTETSVDLAPNARIVIQHMARTHQHDDKDHFLLHYLIAAQLPGYADGWTRECGGGHLPSLGPGCSNSDFP